MNETLDKLEHLLKSGLEYISSVDEYEFMAKPNESKWSKKEILGHLIDSAINNLQRFSEIQFESKPYKIRTYKQEELVRVNNYQNSETKNLLKFWLSINHHIQYLITQQTEEILDYKIELDKNTIKDLRFLIKDYVDHLEHHLIQIMK